MQGKIIKRNLFVILLAASAIAGLILLVIGFATENQDSFFTFFTIPNTAMIIAGAWGIIFLTAALHTKKYKLYLPAVLLLTGAAMFAIITFALLDFISSGATERANNEVWVYYVIGAILLLVFIVIKRLFNVRRADAGDNMKVGYKNYEQRQKEKDIADAKKEIERTNREKRPLEKKMAMLDMDIQYKEQEIKDLQNKK